MDEVYNQNRGIQMNEIKKHTLASIKIYAGGKMLSRFNII